MSLKKTKAQIIKLLEDKDNKVVALSGKWGTGKSYMWDEIKGDAVDNSQIKGSLYASLFGLSSIEQVLLKLIQSAVTSLEDNPSFWKNAKQATKSGIKVLEGFHKGFGALNDLGLVFAPSMLRQRLIVLDDIERKHDDLDIDQVLGFIDEYSQQHNSRFLLILNSDQLNNLNVWHKLREKVVDQEIRLNTSSSEAFNIAASLTTSVHAVRIRSAVEICSLTNIRIIRKIIKAVNQILGIGQALSDAVLTRVIPSTVLLSAIHYNGIEDGPDFDFVLAQGTSRDWSLVDKNEADSEVGQKKSKWKLLIRELGVAYCDDFELLIIEFLCSGLFDVSEVAKIIDRYVAEDDAMNARDDYKTFNERYIWNHTLSEGVLLEEAVELAEKAHLLDPYTVTAFHEILTNLHGGSAVAESVIDQWIEKFKAEKHEDVNLENHFNQTIHPRIETELNSVKEKAQANMSALDACLSIVKKSGWGIREETAMKSASTENMETIIRTCKVEDLRVFMRRMLELCVKKQDYEKHFGQAMDNFTQACAKIARDPESGRLGALIKLLFADAKISDLLDIPHPQIDRDN